MDIDDIDLEDPTSWPQDIAALEALAQGAGAEADDAKAEDAKAEDAAKAEPEQATADKTATGGETPDGETKAGEEPDPNALEGDVLTKDGKSVIPFSVLQHTREERNALQAESARLKEEIEALKGAGANDAPAAPTREPSPHDPYAERIAELEKLKAEDPDDKVMVAVLDGQIAVLKENQTLQQQLQEIKGRYDAQDADRLADRKAQLQEAIDNNPDITEWAEREDQSLHEAAVRRYQEMEKSDPYFQAMSEADRLAQVVEDVKRSPLGKALLKQPPQASETAAKPKPEEPPVPNSLSDLPAGAGAAGVDSDLAAMERMSPAELQERMNQLAAAGRLDSFLAGGG